MCGRKRLGFSALLTGNQYVGKRTNEISMSVHERTKGAAMYIGGGVITLIVIILLLVWIF